MNSKKYIDNNVFNFIEKEKEYKKHLDSLYQIRQDISQKQNLNDHMRYLNQLQNNKFITSFRISQGKLMEIEKNNRKLLERILSISQRKIVQPNFCSGHLMPLGSLSSNRPFSKSLSVDFKRKEANKIMIDNSFLVSRIVKKTPFLPISKINRDFQEHEQYLKRIRKMDSTNNKMKVKGLEKLSQQKLKQLPRINDVSRCLTYRATSNIYSKSKNFRSKSTHEEDFRKRENEVQHEKYYAEDKIDNEFIEDKK